MSQVRNLRAMFENKGDKSPPDRGRSPGVSTSSANPIGASGPGSPRPLSKVRTNFVAIERDGRIGLRRDHSGESSLSRRRMSIETDAESSSTFPDKPVTTSSDDFPKPMRRLFVSEPDSEPLPPPPSDALLPPTPAGAVGDKPSTNPDKQIDQEQSPIALRPADLNAGSALNAPRNAVMTPSPIEGRQSGQSRADKSATPSRTAGTVLKKPGASSQAPAGSQKKAMTNGLQIAKTSIDAPRREANKSVKNSLGTKRGETAPTTRMTTTALRPRPSPNISTTTHKLQPSKGTVWELTESERFLTLDHPRQSVKCIRFGPTGRPAQICDEST
ncbi:hypothetical protein G6O67_004093 [Ophiocordyceps sinensis]|uniref:Uncharacterized protein n=1 Tax=Ophiocordyceps sinensis TaxID=72228 RepID=A0A8H4LY09_9HYPO|nr:hypothetical protein G6O67_004093 [Ophiocordyceps sinensis]